MSITKDSRIHQILKLLSELNVDVGKEGNKGHITLDEYYHIYDNIDQLTENLYGRCRPVQEVKSRVDEIADMMMAMGQLDFSKDISEEGNDENLNSIATGLNMLNYHLKEIFEDLDLYKYIFNNINEILIMTDKYGNIEQANKKAYVNLGISSAELEGINISDYLVDDIPEGIREELIKTKYVESLNARVMGKGGRLIPVSLSIHRLNNKKSNGFIYRMKKE